MKQYAKQNGITILSLIANSLFYLYFHFKIRNGN